MLKTYVRARTELSAFKDRLFRDEGGASLVEYSVLIGLITVATIALIIAVGGWVEGEWNELNTELAAAG